MADTEYKRLIETAKERAVFGFLALSQRALQDTDRNVAQLLGAATSGVGQSALMGVRHFIRQDGNRFVRKVDSLFRVYLERALQTMYVDMRAGMRQLSADELSLIDDESVTQQIEVGRLTTRLRDANEEVIGRLNVMIAMLNGQREAKERENPFRPYLLARCIYEAVRELSPDEAKSRILFDHLANGIAQHLPGYYNSLREVFEQAGLNGKFAPKPSRASHYQRYFGAPPEHVNLPLHLRSHIVPGLQRMMHALQQPGGLGADTGLEDEPTDVHEFIRRMVTPSRSGIQGEDGSAPGRKPSSLNPVAAQLKRFQQQAASGDDGLDGGSGQPNALFNIREKLNLDVASPMDRMTIDVVAMLFSFILDDEQIPLELRRRIGRLQIPVLKAAIIDPGLLQQEDHPVRQLLNRVSSAAVGADPQNEQGQALLQEIDRIADAVLAGFDADLSIFTGLLGEFEQFLLDFATRDDDRSMRGVEAVEAAEKISVLRANIMKALCDVLLPLNIDKRISDVIIHVWPHVLAHALWKDGENRVASDDAESYFRSCRSILPKLIWSIQLKTSPDDRAALIRMLPSLVKQIAKAFEIIGLQEAESREVMDLLIEMHSRVLRYTGKQGDVPPSLDDLQLMFSRMVFNWDRVSWGNDDPPAIRDDVMEEVMARYQLNPVLSFGGSMASASPADREFLAQTYLLGTRVELRAPDGSGRQAQLIWISTHRSLYLFKRDGDGELVIYSYASLLDSLRDGSLVPVEYAPVFERAVDSLLFRADKVKDGVIL
ncbi:DUF1631 family protein [Noviherbaspirillum galbum]|uniref:DUF1631 domain-containing protein n=1 Tax=Noviherbaspirillum galbum TaxID=2709383 RepID=A0A6B3STV1_9BURK|nr:DUF1631 family protein [Noviherbaspirillum galbum]NEX62296.1 DUF1631 domain-containing protein [Noviherbaspirillum galbum]